MVLRKFKIICIANNKGGVGKTILTWILVNQLVTKFKKKVLIIDNDPQHNMSNLLHKLPPHFHRKSDPGTDTHLELSTSNIYTHKTPASDLIRKTHIPNLDIISASITLQATELFVNLAPGRELFLTNWYQDNTETLNQYDYIFIDCNPSMSTININAFHSSDSIILLTDVDNDGLEGIDMFFQLYYPIRKMLDRNATDNVKGIVVNQVDDRTNLSKDFVEYINGDDYPYQELVLKSYIHECTAIKETKLTKQAPKNKRAIDEIKSLITELKKRKVL